jgi:hypothetical protein
LIKNNLKSLLRHISISIISMIVFFLFNMSQPKWATEEAARNHHNIMMFLSITLIVGAVISYYLLARKRLIDQGNIYINLFSVSLTAIIGIILWAIAFNIDRIGPSNRLFNLISWQNYGMFNGYSFFLLEEAEINNPYVFLIFSFIPTIVMWVGIQRKKSASVKLS